MRKYIFVLLTIAFVFQINETNAQTLSKSEKKALKKEIKTYKKDPIKWVKLLDRHKNEVTDLEAEIERLKAELKDTKANNNELIAKIDELNARYNNLLKSMPSAKVPNGTIYQVQMGYYQYLDLVSFNEKLKVVKAEEVDGAKRYVIGYFENVMDAVQFSNDIKSLGIDDAFVTQYVDGERNMEFDALEVIGR
jgi:septal ring factor EnvC (AmiA/AmiB activator)